MAIRRGELGGMASVPSRQEARRIRGERVELLNDPNSYTMETSFGSIDVLKGTGVSGTDKERLKKWQEQSRENLALAKTELLQKLEAVQGEAKLEKTGGYISGQLTNGSEEWFLNGQKIAEMDDVVDYGPERTEKGDDSTSKHHGPKWFSRSFNSVLGRPVLEGEYQEFLMFASGESGRRSAREETKD